MGWGTRPAAVEGQPLIFLGKNHQPIRANFFFYYFSCPVWLFRAEDMNTNGTRYHVSEL